MPASVSELSRVRSQMHSELPEFSELWIFVAEGKEKGVCGVFLVMFFCSSLSFLLFVSSDKHLKPNVRDEMSEPGVLDIPRAAGEPGSFK